MIQVFYTLPVSVHAQDFNSWVRACALKLFQFLEQHNLAIEPVLWNGSVDSLPIEPGPIMVRASTLNTTGWDILGPVCAERVFFSFMIGDQSMRRGKCWEVVNLCHK